MEAHIVFIFREAQEYWSHTQMDLRKHMLIIQLLNNQRKLVSNMMFSQLEFMMNQLFYIINSIINDYFFMTLNF